MSKTNNPLKQKSGISTNIILTIVVVVVAIVVIGGVLLFNRGGGSSGSGDGSVPAEVLHRPDSNKLLDAPNDKVTVTEFLDYQCPACHQYYQGLTKQIEKDYEGKIDFVTRNMPMEDMHPLARPAAQAAEAAALQGKYKQMYHHLLNNWQEWAVAPDGSNVSDDKPAAKKRFNQYAQDIGLDMNKFQQDVNSDRVDQRIERDVKDAKEAQVSGTPTLFINGEQFQPTAKDYQGLQQEFKSKLDEELKK